MFRRNLILFLGACLVAALGLPGSELLAQDTETPEEEVAQEDEDLDFEPEPMSPREALFLAIELKDIEAARQALRQGADEEISLGDPSPLATAALHNDLLMVRLLLSFGGNPGAAEDSPLEEAIRNENAQMVALFLRSGAEVPHAERGRELFWLAQRGEQALELSGILLDHSGNPDSCLTAAAQHGRVDVMRFCLSRGGDVGAMPEDLNILSVALQTGDADFVAQIVGEGLQDKVVAGALPDAIIVGDLDLVRKAAASGAELNFSHIESAVENKHPEICLFLLDQSEPEDPTVLAGGDVASLIQQTDDLGYLEVAAALRRKSGVSWLSFERLLPVAVIVLLLGSLIALLVKNLGRKREAAAHSSSITGSQDARQRSRPAKASIPLRRETSPSPIPSGAPPAQPGASSTGLGIPPVEAAPVQAMGTGQGPAVIEEPRAQAVPVSQPLAPAPIPTTVVDPPAPDPAANYATTVLRIDQLPLSVAPQSSVSQPSAPPSQVPPSPVPQSLDPQPPLPVPVPSPGHPSTASAAPVPAESWQVVPEPVAEAAQGPAKPLVVVDQTAPVIEARMPEVDLTRRADAVFEVARKAAGTGDGQRSIVLVTPQRIPMLYPCPTPETVPPGELAAAERLVPAAVPRNIVAIAFNDLEAANQEIRGAIPFFDLLRSLGFLGHTVWIFEGHVSAMQAGCQEADLLIVDDGMVPYLPGNWRSVASRSMRGAEVYIFERKTGTLRRLG